MTKSLRCKNRLLPTVLEPELALPPSVNKTPAAMVSTTPKSPCSVPAHSSGATDVTMGRVSSGSHIDLETLLSQRSSSLRVVQEVDSDQFSGTKPITQTDAVVKQSPTVSSAASSSTAAVGQKPLYKKIVAAKTVTNITNPVPFWAVVPVVGSIFLVLLWMVVSGYEISDDRTVELWLLVLLLCGSVPFVKNHTDRSSSQRIVVRWMLLLSAIIAALFAISGYQSV